MDCKRVTVIRIGPVISTRMKALHKNVWCFFVVFCVKKRLSQLRRVRQTLLLYFAPRRILKS